MQRFIIETRGWGLILCYASAIMLVKLDLALSCQRCRSDTDDDMSAYDQINSSRR